MREEKNSIRRYKWSGYDCVQVFVVQLLVSLKMAFNVNHCKQQRWQKNQYYFCGCVELIFQYKQSFLPTFIAIHASGLCHFSVVQIIQFILESL